MSRTPLLALAVLLVASPLAQAGTAEAPEVTDPAGDAGPMGVAAPAGFADVDIVGAWFENEGLAQIDLVISLAGAPMGRPNTIWYQRLTAPGGDYFVGYGDFLGGRGASACKVTEEQGPADCQDVASAIEGSLLRMTIPREMLNATAMGDVLSITEGLSFSFYFVPVQLILPLPPGAFIPYDPTPAGIPFVFTTGLAPEGAEMDDDLLGAVNGSKALAPASQGANSTGAATPLQETPAAPLALVVLAGAGLAALRRRR